MSDRSDGILDFEKLAADPEIAALLEFEPVVRKVVRREGWNADLQRKSVASIAATGVRTTAADAVGRDVAGASKLCRAEGGAGFRDACDAALALYQQRRQAQAEANRGGRWAKRFYRSVDAPSPHPLSGEGGEGEVVNEFGEWEDGGSYARRAEEARDSVSDRLLRCRRLFLMSISGEPVKRAAFETLTELPVDWELAARLKPQADEPWRRVSMREPDMLLAAENGWMGAYVHGPDKTAELVRQLNEWRAAQGLGPIDEQSETDA